LISTGATRAVTRCVQPCKQDKEGYLIVLKIIPLLLLLGTLTVALTGRGEEKVSETPTVQDEFNHEGPWRDEFRDIGNELRCPTCTGLSVLESDAKFSVQIKDIVKEKVRAGESKEKILQYFTERYGPWILRSPPKTGFNILAWAFPIGLLLLGPPLVWAFVWRKRRTVSTLGVRPADLIIKEMQERLMQARARS
jgi:cytochrome c-type biogenesis protein CcmH